MYDNLGDLKNKKKDINWRYEKTKDVKDHMRSFLNFVTLWVCLVEELN